MADSGITEAPLLTEDLRRHRSQRSSVHPGHGPLTSSFTRSPDLAAALGYFCLPYLYNASGAQTVHYYDPWDFAGETSGNITQWGPAATNPSKTSAWGQEDYLGRDRPALLTLSTMPCAKPP